jgi:hypothetical protein
MIETIPEKYYAAARKIARDAAKHDTWMRPVVEKGDNFEDFGQFVGDHRAA